MTSRFALPASVTLHYQVSGHSRNQLWEGHSSLMWRHDGADYEARLQVHRPQGPGRVQSSTGSITVEGLAPRRFADKARGENAAHFERDLGKVSFSSNQPDAPLMPGAQDRLSVLMQLSAMLAGEPARFAPGVAVAIQTVGTRDAEAWIFTVGEIEQLQAPGGPVDAIKLTRLPQREYDQKLELWLAPSMDYVPVRLRLTQPNGDWVDQQWSSTDRH